MHLWASYKSIVLLMFVYTSSFDSRCVSCNCPSGPMITKQGMAVTSAGCVLCYVSAAFALPAVVSSPRASQKATCTCMSICRRGELSAAYDALASALGVFTPFLWANLYAYFQRLPEDAFLKIAFGPGGHFIVAAIFRLCSCLVLRACPTEELYIDDEGGTHDGSTRASASTIDEEIRQLYNNNDMKSDEAELRQLHENK